MAVSWLRKGTFALFILSVWAVSAPAAAAELTRTVEFDRNDLTIERSAGFDVVRLSGAASTFGEGLPELPLWVVRFVLPRGTRAVGVVGTVASRTELPGSYTVRPRQPEVPLSSLERAKWVPPDASVYSSSSPYPEVPCVLLDTGSAAGEPIAAVAVYPVQYVPATGKLVFNETVDISLTLADSPVAPREQGPRSSLANEAMNERLRALVVNSESVSPPSSNRGGRGTIDYLIITGPAYQSIFQPLANWKSQKGVTASVVTTSSIYANYAGVDNQEQIRNCIIDYYENHGTTWVLLAGDTDVVPARIVYAMASGAGDDHIRCDLYYADLDGTWNADGDATWGEVGQDQVDMYADIFIGRAPVNTTTEATRFVDKVLTYEGAPGGSALPVDYELRMLFLAEVLWDSPFTDGGVCKDMIDSEAVPSRFDPITKLYQTNSLLTKARTIGNLNEGKGIANHMGHANYNVMSIGSSALYNSDFDALTNTTRQGIMYSIGCWPAAIDYDCIAEHWMNSQGGGVAFVGNSRFGWGSPGNPGNGTSDRFDREFFDQLFNHGLDRIGVTHAAHKDAYAAAAHFDDYTRYCLYELNLLGDPEMRIWTDRPIAAVVNHPAAVPLGEHPFVVTVSRQGAPVAGATVYLASAEISTVATTGADGVAVLSPAPTTEGTLTVTVTGQGVLPVADTVPVVNEPPDTTPPQAVTTLVATDPFDTGGAIELDWAGYESPGDFAFYKLYRETVPFNDVTGLVPIATGILDAGATHWTDDTVEDWVSYYYAVTAVDLSTNENELVRSLGPVASTNNARILVWDADDGDRPFDGIGDDYGIDDGTEVPWVEALDAVGELYTISTTLPSDISHFECIVVLGGVINFGDECFNTPMTEAEVTALTAFVDDGGSLYVEEPAFGGKYFVGGTPASIALWNRFHATFVAGAARNTGNVQSLGGTAGTLTQSLSFPYDYRNWPDQMVGEVGPNGDAGTALLWTDQAAKKRGSRYVDSVTGSHRYMVPVLLGGMSDGPYPGTRLEYVTRLLTDLDLIGTSGIEPPEAGLVNRLDQNAPNPFNPTTTIRYSVARDGARTKLAIYDVAGRLVATLKDGVSTAGEHAARWDGRDSSGSPVASGVYFARLEVGGWTSSRKMALLK
jgi:hypothetical protein